MLDSIDMDADVFMFMEVVDCTELVEDGTRVVIVDVITVMSVENKITGGRDLSAHYQ